MNKRFWRSMALTGVVATAAGAGPAMGFDHLTMGPHDQGRMIVAMADKLNLDAEQETEVKAIYADANSATKADRERLRQLREQLRAQGDNFDPGEAQKLADETGEITSRLVYAMASTHARIGAVLTASQREQLQALQSAHQKSRRGGKWRDAHRSGDRPQED
jgi:Spy/CpxP family protein refolding chaperone